jgi:hypothetical protein
MMGATKIMVIRHAEKPGTYGGHAYDGVDAAGATCGADGAQSLATIGWERAGALTTLFAPPWGPKLPLLATPDYIYAADPAARDPGRRDTEPAAVRDGEGGGGAAWGEDRLQAQEGRICQGRCGRARPGGRGPDLLAARGNRAYRPVHPARDQHNGPTRRSGVMANRT